MRGNGPRPKGWPETGRLWRRIGSKGLRTQLSSMLLASGPFLANRSECISAATHLRGHP